MKDLDSIAQLDRLMLLAPSGPVNFGVVAAPEELGDFAEGDVVKFTDPEQIRDCGNGSFVFVSPAKCEKVTDPELVEEYRSIIYGDSWDEDDEECGW
jgi:hypothetical protein